MSAGASPAGRLRLRGTPVVPPRTPPEVLNPPRRWSPRREDHRPHSFPRMAVRRSGQSDRDRVRGQDRPTHPISGAVGNRTPGSFHLEGELVRRSRTIASLAALAAATAVVATQSTTASAIGVDDVTPVATGFAGPLQFAVNANNRAFVAQSFGPGTITKVTPSGDQTDVVERLQPARSPVSRCGGATSPTPSPAAPWSAAAPRRTTSPGRVVWRAPTSCSSCRTRQGDQRVLGDLGEAEESMNPDGFQAYGSLGVPPVVRRGSAGGPRAPRRHRREQPVRRGCPRPGGGWYVADAAANVIWKVEVGDVTPVTVFKPRVIHITEEMADRVRARPVHHRDPLQPRAGAHRRGGLPGRSALRLAAAR